MSEVGIFLAALLTSSLAMSAVILFLLLLNKLLAGRVSAKSRYLVWLIVLAGLLVPFRPEVPIPFATVQIPISFDAAGASGEGGGVMQNEAPPEGSAIAGAASASEPDASTGAGAASAAERPPIQPAAILFAVWMSGALAFLALHLRSYGKFASYVRRWGVEVDDRRILSVLESAQEEMDLEGALVSVKACMFISSPMLIGFLRPTILLPEQEISPDELNHIFRHELTHYRHRDLWINLAVLAVSAIHWFNPIVRLMAKAIQADCETACDEAAVAGHSLDRRKRYGETIIGFIGTRNAMAPVLSTYFYGGISSMKKRLFSIMDTGRKRKGSAVLCAAAVVMATLLSGNTFAVSASPGCAGQIGDAKAKTIALEHAGISETQAVFVTSRLDESGGRAVYDVEFYSGNIEYDYEIDAANGDVVEFDSEIEGYAIPNDSGAQAQPSQQTASGSDIGEAKAKSIALEHAKITESQAVFITSRLDYDDGRAVYDVEFYSGNAEYDYEIDAASGEILEYDREIEGYAIPNASGTPGQSSQQPASGSNIGEAKAKSIALKHAGITESQAVFITSHLDYDDGRAVYDVEFYSGNAEYDYEIDAASGDIIEYDREIEGYAIPNASSSRAVLQQTAAASTAQHIGEAKAKSIALAAAGLSQSQISQLRVKLGREDGATVYEVEFNNGRIQYEYEISAASGEILKADIEHDD